MVGVEVRRMNQLVRGSTGKGLMGGRLASVSGRVIRGRARGQRERGPAGKGARDSDSRVEAPNRARRPEERGGIERAERSGSGRR